MGGEMYGDVRETGRGGEDEWGYMLSEGEEGE